MRFFGLIILIVIVVNSFTIPGDPIANSPLAGISQQGVSTGLRFAGRLLIVLLVSMVITGTTPLMKFRDAVEWYLRPVPFVPEARVATMINLTFLLIPVILDSFREMMDAQNSRCVQLRKNPVKRIKFLVFPLIDQTLRRADEIAYAMEARCYSEIRTRTAFKCGKIDWLMLAISLAVFFFVLL
jgi:energy-coupling factor transporter transmembrane protein EcfT